MTKDIPQLEKLAKLVRYYILLSTTTAGSGHPTSSMSATELMVGLLFSGVFRANLEDPKFPNNDRLIFSKGHASPLFYSLYAAAGKVSVDELKSLRKFGSHLEGHPTLEFPFTEVPTGSLGQGLSVGVGYGMNGKYLDKLPYRTYVLLGDSEMAEGSVWEALASASFNRLDNLVAILDVNRLGQRGETMYGYNLDVYQKRLESFGWHTIVVDGHNLPEVLDAYNKALQVKDKPTAIIAKTVKGKGVSFLEDKDDWHGKALNREEFDRALVELGEVDMDFRGAVFEPLSVIPAHEPESRPLDTGSEPGMTKYELGQMVATRKAYGNVLVNIAESFPAIVALDGETSNSTYADSLKKTHPEKFFEMYIAEQNMVGVALGLSVRGKIPFVSTFAAFLTRAFDQIRMSQYADSNIKFIGSHAGVSIGEDGSSQMALEDLAMFRTLLGAVVLYPSDAMSTEKLVALAAAHTGNVYIRTTRKETAVIYDAGVEFPIGGSKTLESSDSDVATVIGAGVTLHEALAAYKELQGEGINVRVIDLYSIKPLDIVTLKKAAQETKRIITVEDHFAEGGLGEAVAAAIIGESVQFKNLAVRKMPHSGKPQELLDYEEISSGAIVKSVKSLIN